MTPRRRLDAELVRRGLCESRQQAQTAVVSGRVLVAGSVADKVSRMVSPAEPVLLQGPPEPFVGRGGRKLSGALDHFGLDPTGWRCLDAGASTGGFTDCLLQRGAAQVVAVDVGHGQLHERLRGDERVTVHDRTNVRALTSDTIGGEVDAVVADLSFISLRSVASALVACARPGAPLVVLVKPQFEVGKAEASKGRGVIRDPALWRQAVSGAVEAFDLVGAGAVGVVRSSITGADGNVEYLLLVRKGEPASPWDALVSGESSLASAS